MRPGRDGWHGRGSQGRTGEMDYLWDEGWALEHVARGVFKILTATRYRPLTMSSCTEKWMGHPAHWKHSCLCKHSTKPGCTAGKRYLWSSSIHLGECTWHCGQVTGTRVHGLTGCECGGGHHDTVCVSIHTFCGNGAEPSWQ